ncbi:hypothetical protein BXA49_16385, partial [Enterococcus faecium]
LSAITVVNVCYERGAEVNTYEKWLRSPWLSIGLLVLETLLQKPEELIVRRYYICINRLYRWYKQCTMQHE